MFVSNHPRPASLSPRHDENPATVRPELRSVTPLAATLMDLPASVANKRLTGNLSPLDATLTKKTGVGSPLCFSTFQRSNVQTCNDLRPNSFHFTSLAAPHPLTPIESHPYKNHRGAPPIFSVTVSYLFALLDQTGRVYTNISHSGTPRSSPPLPNLLTCKPSNLPALLAPNPIPAPLRLLPNVPTFKRSRPPFTSYRRGTDDTRSRFRFTCATIRTRGLPLPQ